MPALFALAALATLAAGHVQIEPKDGWVEGLNLFVAVGMGRGERKTAVYRDVTAPILTYEKTLRETAQPDIREMASIRRIAETALAKAEKAAATTKDPTDRAAAEEEARRLAQTLEHLDVPTAPRLFTDDCTPEALASLLFENHERIAVLSAEGGIFDQMAGRYNSGRPNLDVYLKGHAGDFLRVDRVGRLFEYVDHPALTVGLAVQPYVFTKAARNADVMGRGMLDRFLYGLPAGRVGFRDTAVAPLATEVRFRYDTTLRAFAETFNGLAEPVSLLLSDAAPGTFQQSDGGDRATPTAGCRPRAHPRVGVQARRCRRANYRPAPPGRGVHRGLASSGQRSDRRLSHQRGQLPHRPRARRLRGDGR